MIAILGTEQAAQEFENQIQAYLTANRPRYNAERWAVPQKHPAEDKWAVSLPPEPVDVPEGATIVEQLTGDWYPVMDDK